MPHAPDLFHVQQELCRGTAPVLAAQTRQEQQRLVDAQARLTDLRRQQHEAAQKPRPPGRPVDYPMWIREAEHAATWAAQRVATAQGRQERMREAIRGLSADYHPFDLTTAVPLDAAQVRTRLEARFTQIEQLAQEAKLPEHSRARIAKARRVLDGLVAAVAFFWLRAQGMMQNWPASLAEVWRRSLLAGWYLRQVAGKVAGAVPRRRACSGRGPPGSCPCPCPLGGGGVGGGPVRGATVRGLVPAFEFVCGGTERAVRTAAS